MKSIKRLAASIKKVGLSRVKIKEPEQCKEALTREDVKNLIKKGAIEIKKKRGVSRGRARKLHEQKKKGRRRGKGSRKGHKSDSKRRWIIKVRAQRKFIKYLKEKQKITQEVYKELYRKVKGGFFRSVSHIKIFLKKRV